MLRSVELISYLLFFTFQSSFIQNEKGRCNRYIPRLSTLMAPNPELEIIRVIQPGIFDFQATEYVIRMRVWGVSFPKRGQPQVSIRQFHFAKKCSYRLIPILDIIRTFDEKNLKVVKVGCKEGN